jgi:hypothetical protein
MMDALPLHLLPALTDSDVRHMCFFAAMKKLLPGMVNY